MADFELTPEAREYLALFVGFLSVWVPSLRNYLELGAGKVGESMLRVAARRPHYFGQLISSGLTALPLLLPRCYQTTPHQGIPGAPSPTPVP